MEHEPDDDRHRQDVGPRLHEEVLSLLPRVQADAGERGHAVRRQLHDEGRRGAAEERLLEDHAHDDRERDPEDVERPHDGAGAPGEEHADAADYLAVLEDRDAAGQRRDADVHRRVVALVLPSTMGMNDFPWSPIACIGRSMTKAARAM